MKKLDKRDQKRIAIYKKHRDTVGELILQATLKSLASVEAMGMVSNILQIKYNLTDVELDQKEFDSMVTKILRSEIGSILVRYSSLSVKNKERLMRRILAQVSPTRDNVLPSIQPASPPRQRIEDLEHAITKLIKQESANLEKSR